jgi:hypothetical protein
MPNNELKRKCKEKAEVVASLSVHKPYVQGAAYSEFKKDKEKVKKSSYVGILTNLLY